MKRIGNRHCLIITATIKPNSVVVSQYDESDRRLEYLAVLKFYLKNYSSAIFFIENSVYDFSQDKEFQEIFAHNRVHLLKFPPSNEYEKGKGFQEFEMLDRTINQIRNDFDEIIKVTGRYIVTNFNKLHQQLNRGLVIDRHQKKEVAITSFFKCLISQYDNFITGAYKEVDDSKGINIEHILYNRLKDIDNGKIDLFTRTPVYKGISGSYGGNLNRHPLKTKLINLERIHLSWQGVKELKKEFK